MFFKSFLESTWNFLPTFFGNLICQFRLIRCLSFENQQQKRTKLLSLRMLTMLWVVRKYLSGFQGFKLEESRPKTIRDQGIIHYKFRCQCSTVAGSFYKDFLHRLLKRMRVWELIYWTVEIGVCLTTNHLLTHPSLRIEMAWRQVVWPPESPDLSLWTIFYSLN